MSAALEAECKRQIARLCLMWCRGQISFRMFIILACCVYTEFCRSYAEEQAAGTGGVDAG